MSATPPPFRVALLGYGTIGSSLHRLLEEHRAHIRHATGREVEVVAALVRDAARPRQGIAGAQMQIVDDADAFFAIEADLVCEALGGLEPARTLALRALGAGTPLVTANKQLIAHHGRELWAAAEQHGAQLRFEASVGGAIPIVRVLRESLVASRVDRVLGILNGTTNYILSAMTASGAAYADALADAQRLGYAEPDPSDDVLGRDASAKLAILASIAFHTGVPADAPVATGIDGVTDADIAFAGQLGYRIKLIGRAERTEAGVALDVGPRLLPAAHPLAAVNGATNAVLVDGTPFGRLTLQGAGAGGPETASALAGDIVGVMGSSPSFLTRDPQAGSIDLVDPAQRSEPCFVRMEVPDRPGVLATVAGSFATHDVSIERVIQRRTSERSATLVLTTHPAPVAAVAAALADTPATDHSLLPMLDSKDHDS